MKSKSGHRIRRAEQRDFAAVASLRRYLSRQESRARPEHFRTEPLGLTEAFFAAMLAERNVTTLVIESESGAIAGYAIVWIGLNWGSDWTYPARVGYLREIAVDELFRRQGLGRELLAAAEAVAQREQAETLGLHVTAGNAKARAFYQAEGFGTTGEYRHKILNPVVRLENH